MLNAPWNKGRLTGQKRPLKRKDVWAIRVRLQLQHRARDLALFNLAIDSKLRGCDLVRLQVDDVCAGGSGTAPLSFRKRRAGRSSSKSPNRPEPRSGRGFPRSKRGMDSTSSRAASARSRTSRHGSMRGLYMPGSRAPDLTAPPMARTRCGERRRPRSTRRRATCGRCSFSSGIQSSKAPSATLASRSMTRSASRSRSSCELRQEEVAALRGAGSRCSARQRFLRPHRRPLPPTNSAARHHDRKPRGRVTSGRPAQAKGSCAGFSLRRRPLPLCGCVGSSYALSAGGRRPPWRR
jgi:hypothetical protein